MKTAAVVLAALALSACTVIFIRGNGNMIEETRRAGFFGETPHPLRDLLKDKAQQH